VLAGMAAEAGLYVLDEPESALSFDSSLMLLAIMTDMVAAGSQILLATRSPILAALPGADLRVLDDRGIRAVSYDDSDLVTSWRHFLNHPENYLRHLRQNPDDERHLPPPASCRQRCCHARPQCAGHHHSAAIRMA